MNRTLARWGKQLAARAGWRVRRAGPENRFDGMRDALEMLARRGLQPRVVIDGGSNLGQWTTLASIVFPAAAFHLIEPQPACQTRLRQAFPPPRYQLHPVALTAPGTRSVRMAGDGLGTGAFVTGRTDHAGDTFECPATTLDDLFASGIGASDRALLKLDLESHELAALHGATRLLPLIEVIVLETSFFDVQHEGRPLFGDMLTHLHAHSFQLYDFASLSSRPRDQRLRMGDAVFVRLGSPLLDDVSWD